MTAKKEAPPRGEAKAESRWATNELFCVYHVAGAAASPILREHQRMARIALSRGELDEWISSEEAAAWETATHEKGAPAV
jgi:hypothetical protein